MHIEETIFNHHKPDFARFAAYGFVACPEGYRFSQDFGNGAYRAEVLVSTAGKVAGRVLDLESGDDFLPLRVDALNSETIQNVREAYADILRCIANACFTPLLFLHDQGNRIASLISERYQDTPDFPWKKFPHYGVFRHQQSRKWYGLIMNIPPARLYAKNLSQKARLPQYICTQDKIEILNLKIHKDEIASLNIQNGIFPGYHLNAKYWISVLLEDILPDERIMKLVDKSHAVTLPCK